MLVGGICVAQTPAVSLVPPASSIVRSDSVGVAVLKPAIVVLARGVLNLLRAADMLLCCHFTVLSGCSNLTSRLIVTSVRGIQLGNLV